MDIRQIEYFLAACKTLNFTRAAEKLDVAVPTLSRSIAKLETELGGQLFRRERHLTHLTDLGRLMQTHLSTAHKATVAAKVDAQKYLKSDTRLRIGIISTLSASHLVAFLQAIRLRNSELSLEIWESHCADISQALDNGEIDVAIMSAPEYDEQFRVEELYQEYYLVAFPEGHRFERFVEVPLREIEGEDYIKRLHCEFPSNFIRLGVAQPYTHVRQCYSTEREDWVQSMVASGLGLTLMPEYLPIIPGIKIRRLVDPEVSRTISLVTRIGRQHGSPVKLAIECARSISWTDIESFSTSSRKITTGNKK